MDKWSYWALSGQKGKVTFSIEVPIGGHPGNGLTCNTRILQPQRLLRRQKSFDERFYS